MFLALFATAVEAHAGVIPYPPPLTAVGTRPKPAFAGQPVVLVLRSDEGCGPDLRQAPMVALHEHVVTVHIVESDACPDPPRIEEFLIPLGTFDVGEYRVVHAAVSQFGYPWPTESVQMLVIAPVVVPAATRGASMWIVLGVCLMAFCALRAKRTFRNASVDFQFAGAVHPQLPGDGP